MSSRPPSSSASQPLHRPEELDRLDPSRSAVIEASAGTGKTYLLEHLVLELVITGRARLDQILIVTFTERATQELVLRIRRKIDQALGADDSATAVVGWTLDGAARARLAEARQSFDQATISTIHAFCQGILTDEPLATGRLLGQTQVDGRQAFADSFRDVLRRELTTQPAHVAYLDAYLGAGRSVDQLEELLYKAAAARGAWASRYDEAALRDVVERLAALDPDEAGLENALGKRVSSRSAPAILKRLRKLVAAAREVLQTRVWGRMLAAFDGVEDIFEYFESIDELPNVAAILTPLQDVARRALAAAPPLDEAIAQRFLPVVESHLRGRKLAEGLYDYDDMIRAAAEAIEGTHGTSLIEKLRNRYRFALVDEAQDTEPDQWRIFRRVFLESPGPHPVVLIGDPKQAIYGFRGADVHTYVQARDEIRARNGIVLPLSRNFRSHPELVAACNAVLDHQANPRYFSGDDIAYDRPVTATKAALGDGPGVTLLTAETGAEGGAVPRVGTIRMALRAAITGEIQRLAAAADGPRLSEIHVLVRTNAEAREVSDGLHRAGIPNLLFRPDLIFKSLEASHVRALLLAIADPTDRAARLAAWLTPFFDVALADLATMAGDPPPDHPLLARLGAWKELGDAHDFDALWSRILDDSGVAERLRLSSSGLRQLTNYRQLFDILLTEASSRPSSLEDLAALIGAFAAGHRRASVVEDDTQRLETEADAVRIMTIHAAKGLEADIVFLYGGLTGQRVWRDVHAMQGKSGRMLCAGKPRRQQTIGLLKAAEEQEDQRLLYVAMTRARKHLFLPFFPAIEPGDADSGGEFGRGDSDPFRRLTGAYRHVNQRLRALSQAPESAALFRRLAMAVIVQGPTPADQDSVRARVASWTPDPGLVAPVLGVEIANQRDREAAASLRARRRGFAITSYSRLAAAGVGHRPTDEQPSGPRATGARPLPPDDPDANNVSAFAASAFAGLAFADPRLAALVDPVEGSSVDGATDPSDDREDALPGGIASGLFLHAILENAAWGPLPSRAVWQEQPEVRRLIESEARRWDREPRHFEAAARLVHAALTTPIRMPDGATLPGLAQVARVRREVEFLYPLPSAAVASELSAWPEDTLVQQRGSERGFVRGALDVIFEHGGRVCFADWKSNILPNYSREAVRTHVASNYELQIQIYTLAVVRMLGITDAAGYERRFGGVVYLFLRGLKGFTEGQPIDHRRGDAGDDNQDGDGLYVRRPAYAEVERWIHDLAGRHVAGAGGGGS